MPRAGIRREFHTRVIRSAAIRARPVTGVSLGREVLCIPRGAVHHFANTGDLDAKALAIVTPGILGPDYFREVAAILNAAAVGPPDLAAIAAVMRRHGLTPVS